MTADRINVPPRTTMRVVIRASDGWLVFTACPSCSAPLADMLGTALLLRDDGTAARVTYRPDEAEQIMEVFPL